MLTRPTCVPFEKAAQYSTTLEDSFMRNVGWTGAALISVCLFLRPAFGDPVRKITIDGNFADWADVPFHKDPAHNEHDTSHSKRDDTPAHVEHADVDIL